MNDFLNIFGQLAKFHNVILQLNNWFFNSPPITNKLLWHVECPVVIQIPSIIQKKNNDIM